MSRYEAYAEYKDSGEEWLGHVPAHWDVMQIKRLSSVKRGASPRPIDDPKYFDDDGEYAWTRIADVTASDVYLTQAPQKLSKLGSSLSVKLEPEALFLSIAGTVGKPCITGIKACIHDGFVYFPELKIPSKFLFYVFAGEQAYKGLGKFGTQLNLNTDTVGGIKIGCTGNSELENIVQFLDHETAKIDALIEKQQQLIKLLKEKRQAVISHAVIKGLNPTVPMHDPGVEWISEIPKHWNKSSLGFECSVKARLGWKGLKAEEYVDDGYIFLATPNLKGAEIDFENVNYITRERYDESPEIMLEVGDVLVTKDGSTTGTANVVRALPAPATVNSSIAVLRTRGRMDSLYLYYFFVSTYIQNVIKRMQGGMGVPHLFQADLRKFDVVVPPVEEQREIVAYIESKLPKFDLLMEKAYQEVGLLIERRTALISAAVTGKIDVRNWQAPSKTTNQKNAA